MTGNTQGFEERIQRLETIIKGLTARIERLEGGEAPSAVAPTPGDALPSAATIESAAAKLASVPALLGRTCLVLGGAFLFRSLAESQSLAPGLAVTLGVIYALSWLIWADRAGARGNQLSGAFHALASGLIAYPLVFEATIRFELIGPLAAVAVLVLTTLFGLTTAWRRSFRTVAWITLVFALGTTVGLLFRTRAVLPFTLFLLGLAVGSLILAYGRDWRWQRWMVAVSVDLVVLMLGVLSLLEKRPDWLQPGPVLVAQMGLVLVYLGAFVWRLLLQARDVTAFAITQTILVLIIGFEGALLVGGSSVALTVAVVSLVVGVVLHAVVSRSIEAREGHEAAFAYFSTLATLLVAEAARILLPSGIDAAVWAMGAVALAILALPRSRPVFQVQSGLLAIAAAFFGSVVISSLAAFVAGATSEWPSSGAIGLVTLGLCTVTYALLLRGAPSGKSVVAVGLARVGVLFVAMLGFGGLLVRVLGSALAGAPAADADPGRLAVVRTGVLAIAALALAFGYLKSHRREMARLMWLLLAAGGLKMLAEDLRLGRAGTLVFSLALYGTALIVAPALARKVKKIYQARESETADEPATDAAS